MADRGPISSCLDKHGSNSTIEFHECMCNYDYSYARATKIKALKIKHCHEAAEMYKMGNFYSYIVIVAAIIVGVVAFVAFICSVKWYWETKKNPCTCCSFFCCCNRHRKRKQKNPGHNDSINVFEQNETGHTWSPVNLPPHREGENVTTTPPTPTDDSRDPSVCMNFCLSDPVQDCCEFFDCDIMWRKKSIYTIPIFGRKKQQQQQHQLQRRPTRPAPPPPKAVVLPQIKYPEPIVMDDDECEPVPEAPPSPEPVRTLPPKALYVDPLAFLQRTLAKNNVQKVADMQDTEDDKSDKQEPLYSKFKNMVLSKVKKSVSMASINKLGISVNPNGVSDSPSGPVLGNKKMKTASLASLHNLGDADLDVSYGSKRSLSLASLHMLEEQITSLEGISQDPRTRLSVMSTATDDIPPSARKDEYIDLEEVSRRIEARMLAAQSLRASPEPPKSTLPPPPDKISNSAPHSYTPNFMPASAFTGVMSSFNPNQPSVFESQRFCDNDVYSNNMQSMQYYPSVPASQGKPAVPARTVVGSPSYSMSPAGTLGRSKPVVPPRPPVVDGANYSPIQRAPTSPRNNTLPRSPRLVKPSGPPPPPPPGVKAPIESAI